MTSSFEPTADGIVAKVKDGRGLTETTLGELREELGYKKLGRWVLAEITEALERSKLGYFPLAILDPTQNDEPRQSHKVWIYDMTDNERAQVIGAVLRPDKHDVRAALDGLVAGRAEALTAEQKIDRIRALIGA